MLLRPYQKRLVDKATEALKKHKNTLVVGATGMGKTICLSALSKEIGGKTLILQHRQELVGQNSEKFLKVNPGWRVSFFDADSKSFGGNAVFSMMQTLVRNLEHIPRFDHVIVDECHLLPCNSYSKIIDACRDKNPDLLLSGFTATPTRGDKKSLRRFFNNLADKVTIKELVSLGFLVPPRAFVVDVGAQNALSQVQSSSSFGDQAEVAKILDTTLINNEVVKHWKEKASGRKTIVFCSTVQHAVDVAATFEAAGVNAGVIRGDMPDVERKAMLQRFDQGDLQVITNVSVLVEGFDSQPVSCVILLRKCSEKGAMVQMVGRGLRIVDHELYPGVVKKDCIVLDFGISLVTHGNLEQEDGLHIEEQKKGDAPVKTCPEEYSLGVMQYRFPDKNGLEGCGAELPVNTRVCPFCGFTFERIDGKETITEINLSEIDILTASPFRWVDLFGTDTCLMASGFNCWAGIFSPDKGETYHAIGGTKEDKKVHKLAVSGRLQAMSAADDMMRAYSTESAAKKTRRWLDEPATEKQLELLRRFGYQVQSDILGQSIYTKYKAACLTNFHFNQSMIEKYIGVK